MKKLNFALALSLALALPPVARGAADNILSGNIKEADGSTGQNTNLGSGVKTAHLQDEAVTGPKIAPGAVGVDQLGDGAITSSKLAAGAVTPDKLQGPIPGSLVSPVGLDADTVDGLHASEVAPAGHVHDDRYVMRTGNVIVVAPTGGDTADLEAAAAQMDRSTVIYLAPGQYVISGSLTIRGTLIGAGASTTQIRRAVPAGDPKPYAIRIEDSGAVRGVYVETSGAATATVVLESYSSTPELRDSTIVCGSEYSGSSAAVDVVGYYARLKGLFIQTWAYGQSIAIRTRYGADIIDSEMWPIGDTCRGVVAPGGTISNSKVVVQHGGAPVDAVGIEAGYASITGTEVVAGGATALKVTGSSQVERSSLSGTTAITGPGSLRVANTKVTGSISSTGSLRCVGLYDEATYAPVSCP